MDAVNLRLFVAIELPTAVREALAATIDRLKGLDGTEGLRWVRPEGIHITKKFLGSVHKDDAPKINEALHVALTGAPTFNLQVEGLGSFGGPRTMRVIWAGVGGDTAALTSVAGRVETACGPLGFKRERRPFAVHLTLARVREDAPPELRERLNRQLADQPNPQRAMFHVKHCSLMQSTLKPGGAVYNTLATYPLVEAR